MESSICEMDSVQQSKQETSALGRRWLVLELAHICPHRRHLSHDAALCGLAAARKQALASEQRAEARKNSAVHAGAERWGVGGCHRLGAGLGKPGSW